MCSSHPTSFHVSGIMMISSRLRGLMALKRLQAFGGYGLAGWQFTVLNEISNAKLDVFVINENSKSGGCHAFPCVWDSPYMWPWNAYAKFYFCQPPPVNFRLVAWLITTFWAPVNTSDFLQATYGDWRNPFAPFTWDPTSDCIQVEIRSFVFWT